MTRRDDDRLERTLARILRGGAALSTLLLTAGLVLTFTPAPPFVGASLLRAGIVVLVATPITRVAASVVGYLVSRDWLFVVLTSVVLLELGGAVAAAVTGR